MNKNEEKDKAFWFHYNKPESLKSGKPQITLHWNGGCHILDNVICDKPTMGRIRKNQPRWVIAGRGKVLIKDKIAIIK